MKNVVRSLAVELCCLPSHSSLGDLFRVVRNHPITVDDVQEFVKPDNQRYNRKPAVTADGFQILVLTWLPGQESPIHNHRGSQCCVRVLQGTAVETLYMSTHDGFFETRADRYAAGSLFGGEDADIHAVGNDANADDWLVTMHVYRPALTRMELFEVEDGRLVAHEPIAPSIS